jgi:L-ornithine Nalpha-acyltransferase
VKHMTRRMVGRLRSPHGLAVKALLGQATIASQLVPFALRNAVPEALALRRRRPRKVYGQIGGLEVRLAESKSDIRRAQRLRYRVFYEEMAASPSLTAQMRRRDEDPYDAICDHLLVTDLTKTAGLISPWPNGRKAKVVGTYRLLPQAMAERGRGFYTQGEFNIAPLIQRQPVGTRFLELGRSCVLEPYRTKRTVELLWHGLWTYVRENKVDVMIGCASFEGTDPSTHAMALSLLHHQSLAPPEWRCRAHDKHYQSMDLIPKDQLDLKAALKAMPPLIKGYMRLGAFVGDGAVVDQQFGTTDVLIVMPVAKINPRYFGHFGAPDELRSRVAAEH